MEGECLGQPKRKAETEPLHFQLERSASGSLRHRPADENLLTAEQQMLEVLGFKEYDPGSR